MPTALPRALVLLSLVRIVAAAFSFVSVGDWGGATLGGYHQSNAVAVAKQLGKTAGDVGAHFVINTGDNFYYCGVKTLQDEQFKADFEDIYTDESLFVPWYGILGNHDYAFSVDAQLNYKSPNNDRWQMPARYYSKRVQLSGPHFATLIFLDTNPCVQDYLGDDPHKWDPCSGDFGNECQMETGKCEFHDNVVAQDCGQQVEWLKHTLAAVDKDDWIIAAGHHPANEVDAGDLIGPLLARRAHVYLNGHTHLLDHYHVDGRTDMDFLTTGAGCMVHSHAEDGNQTPSADRRKVDVFSQRTSGFTAHTFAEDFSTLKTTFLDVGGNVLHSFVTAKNGTSPSPSPSPSPPSPPSPAGTCKSLGCNYVPSRECQCNRFCKWHRDCCNDYDKVCRSPRRKGSCKTYKCHKRSRFNKCQCDRGCHRRNDCCDDYDSECSGDARLVV